MPNHPDSSTPAAAQSAAARATRAGRARARRADGATRAIRADGASLACRVGGADRADRVCRVARSSCAEYAGCTDRATRVTGATRAECADGADRADRAGRADRADRGDCVAHRASCADCASCADRAGCADRADRADRGGCVSSADRASCAERASRADGADRAGVGRCVDRVRQLVVFDRVTWFSYTVDRVDGTTPAQRDGCGDGGDGTVGSGGGERAAVGGSRARPMSEVKPGRLRRRGERGAVTAEMALVLPVLVSVLLLGIWSIGLVVLNIRCIDAARDVARAVARGESVDQAKAIGHRTVPTGTIVITREASDIKVVVTAVPAHAPPLLGVFSPASLTATAILQAEPETP